MVKHNMLLGMTKLDKIALFGFVWCLLPTKESNFPVIAVLRDVQYFTIILGYNHHKNCYIIAYLPKRQKDLLYKSNLPNWSFTETSGILKKLAFVFQWLYPYAI